jgi:hypothetical protein
MQNVDPFGDLDRIDGTEGIAHVVFNHLQTQAPPKPLRGLV